MTLKEVDGCTLANRGGPDKPPCSAKMHGRARPADHIRDRGDGQSGINGDIETVRGSLTLADDAWSMKPVCDRSNRLYQCGHHLRALRDVRPIRCQ
jgi:hypothetical protein